MTIFGGTLWLLALTGARWLGAITPIGGLLLMSGWIHLMVIGFCGWTEPQNPESSSGVGIGVLDTSSAGAADSASEASDADGADSVPTS